MYHFKIGPPPFLHIDRPVECQLFSTWFPKQSHLWCSVPKKVVNNGLFQLVFGHFVLKIYDASCYAKPVFANGAIGFSQSMGHQWQANEPLLSHIASHGTVPWAFSCQKNSHFPLILDTDGLRP